MPISNVIQCTLPHYENCHKEQTLFLLFCWGVVVVVNFLFRLNQMSFYCHSYTIWMPKSLYPSLHKQYQSLYQMTSIHATLTSCTPTARLLRGKTTLHLEDHRCAKGIVTSFEWQTLWVLDLQYAKWQFTNIFLFPHGKMKKARE